MRTLRALLICGSAASLAVGILPAHASQAMLDPRFGQHGVAEFALGGEPDPVSVVAGPAGTSVVGAVVFHESDDSYHSVVGRFTADGALDPTFGTGGQTELAAMGGAIEQIVMSPDGGVVAIGWDPNAGAFVERLTAAGTVDQAFGNAGVVQLPRGEGLAVQPDGKILVVGLTTVYRLMADGSRDLGFGVDGAWNLGNPPTRAGYLQAVTVLADGSILAGGDGGGPTGLWKLTSSGLPDLNYGTNGASTFAIQDPDSGTIWSEALHLLPEADGNVIVTGGIGTSDSAYVAVVGPTGLWDRTFGTNGITTFNAHFGAATSTDGSRIYVTYTGHGNPSQITTTRLTASGIVDPTFGSSGSLTWIGDYRWTIAADSFLRDGRLTVVGEATDVTMTDNPGVLLRYIVDRHVST